MARIPTNPTAQFVIMKDQAIQHLKEAQAIINRIYDAMDVATGAPRDYAKLEGNEFGVIASGTLGAQGEAYWNNFGSIRTALNDANLKTFVGNIDNGG